MLRGGDRAHGGRGFPLHRGCGLVFRRAGSQPERVEGAQRPVHAHDVAVARVVREDHRHVVSASDDVFGHAVEGSLRTHLDEDAGACVVERFESLHELHGRADLPRQDVHDALGRIRTGRIERSVDVGHHGNAGRVQLDGLEDPSQLLGGGRDDAGMERMAHGKLAGPEARLLQCLHRSAHGLGGAADDAFLRAVHVGHDDVAVHRVHDGRDLVQGTEDRGHEPVVVGGQAGHGLAAGADRTEGVAEADGVCGDQGPVLPQGVAHHHVGLDAVRAEQPGECRVDGEHRRLGDGRLAQILLGLPYRLLVTAVHEDARAEGTPEGRRHGGVGLVEGLGHDGLSCPELLEHAHVLGTLSGEEERHLSRRAPTEVDAFVPERAPPAVVVVLQRRDGLGGGVGELGGVTEIDRHANRGLQIALARRLERGRFSGARPGFDLPEAIGHVGGRIPADDERAAQGGLGCRADRAGRDPRSRLHLRAAHLHT